MTGMFRGATSFNRTLCWNDLSAAEINGMFVNSTGTVNSECEFCGFGKFRKEDRSCGVCPAGSFAPLPPGQSSGAVSCTPCPAGHSNPADGQAACFLCRAGTFQPNEGQDICVPCPGGYFGVDEGQTSCDDACAVGTVSSDGATSCEPFTSETLRVAVSAWCDDEESATRAYGHISTWKTGGVTDMSSLFAPSGWKIRFVHSWWDSIERISESGACGDGGSNDFDADIANWDGRSTSAHLLITEVFLTPYT